jgi:hypothetical protein
MKYIFRTLIAFTLIFTISCEDKLTELNVSPNTSPVANDAQVLTSSIGYLGYVQDVDLNFGSFLWAQYYTWGIGVSLGNAERFVSEPDDNDGYWQRAYANCLTDLKFLSKSESAAYRGVSKVLTAYIYQGLVDHFGDVPFSEAVSGEIADGSILTPAFDDAADIYSALADMLDEALEEFSIASDDIGDDDVLFQGDLTAWVKFANSLKLRVLMRTSEVDPQSAAIQALILSGDFISTADDIPAIPYSDQTGNQNPMFARAEWGVGDFYFASDATLDVLRALNDPRIDYFYSPATTGANAGEIAGICQGCVDRDVPFVAPATDYSGSSEYAYAETNPVLLMSPWEVWFLRAEAAARYGTADDEANAFSTAITENFNYIGVPDAASYIASLSYDSGEDLDIKLDLIATQKWISLNGTQEDEGWIETRRFDRPASDPFRGGIFQEPVETSIPGQFPNTFLYPASERSLNPKAPSQRTITDKIFWDN